METRSYFQSRVDAFTSLTIFLAVMSGPEGILRGCFCPVACTLMFVPPTSIIRILWGGFAESPITVLILRGFSNPPENFRQYLPLVFAVECDRFVFPFFRL